MTRLPWRLLKRLLVALSFLPLPLLAATLFLWHRATAGQTFDEIVYGRAGGHYAWVISNGGHLSVNVVADFPQDVPFAWRTLYRSASYTGNVYYTQTTTVVGGGDWWPDLWVFRGNAAIVESHDVPIAPPLPGWGVSTLWRTIAIALAPPCLIPCFVTARLLVRRHRSRMLGRCRRCGYDLRATPTRCPECGMVPKPSHVIAAHPVVPATAPPPAAPAS